MWFDSNKLTIIFDKCQAIYFGRGRPQIMIIRDQMLDLKSTCKNIELQIAPLKSFTDHIYQVIKELNRFCG